MLKSTYDYILTICYVWLIIIGFFIVITLEIMILIGFIFPLLIIIILNREKKGGKGGVGGGGGWVGGGRRPSRLCGGFCVAPPFLVSLFCGAGFGFF